jgi:hypothetical protein
MVKLSPEAARTHLIAGMILIALALTGAVAAMHLPGKFLPVLIFFFRVYSCVDPDR